MRTLLKRYLIYTFAAFLVSRLGLGLSLTGGLSGTLFSTFLLTVILFIKPFIDALLFPIHLLTLNLSVWLTYIIFIFIWSLVSPEVRFLAANFSGGHFASITIAPMMIPFWLSVVLNSLILVLTIKFLLWIFK